MCRSIEKFLSFRKKDRNLSRIKSRENFHSLRSDHKITPSLFSDRNLHTRWEYGYIVVKRILTTTTRNFARFVEEALGLSRDFSRRRIDRQFLSFPCFAVSSPPPLPPLQTAFFLSRADYFHKCEKLDGRVFLLHCLETYKLFVHCE